MEEFPSQSRKVREPREVQPVTLKAGRIRKPPVGRRFLETFFLGDARTSWSNMIWDSFFPNLRDNIKDSVHDGIDSLFGGTASVYRPGRGRISRNSQINKHNPDMALGSRPNERISREDRQRQNTSGVEIDSRVEAEEVLAAMNRTIDQFDVVTLAEFYQLVRITPDHTDYKWGWEDLGGSHIVHSRGSYYVELPDPIPLR